MILSLLISCMPDDYGDTSAPKDTNVQDTNVEDTDTGSASGDTIVGDWLSEGDDISDLLAPYFTSAEGHFHADGSYTASAVYTDGSVLDFAGTYTSDTSTDPASIVLSQTSPNNVTSKGIYAVDGDVLTYEVVQTSPDAGYTPPTPESGFGTTSGPQIEPGVNVQTYRRM